MINLDHVPQKIDDSFIEDLPKEFEEIDITMLTEEQIQYNKKNGK